MSLRLPSEIIVESFLPTVRAALASELNNRGMTQQEIADSLGISQPAVSKYANGEVGMEQRFLDDPRMTDTVERVADGISDGRMDEMEVLAELLALIRAFEDRGPICEVHEERMPSLEGMGCDLCVRGHDSDILDEREVLSTVRKAARILENTRGMADHIPNVGTNIGAALSEPKDETDVAAIPGRIYAMRGRVNVPANPEFGASKHVAETVLAANSVDSEIRGALNIATSDEIIEAAQNLGVMVLEFDADYEDRGERLREIFEDRGEVPSVIYHRGAFGIEPVTYIFGESAVDAAELAAELVGTIKRDKR